LRKTNKCDTIFLQKSDAVNVGASSDILLCISGTFRQSSKAKTEKEGRDALEGVLMDIRYGIVITESKK